MDRDPSHQAGLLRRRTSRRTLMAASAAVAAGGTAAVIAGVASQSGAAKPAARPAGASIPAAQGAGATVPASSQPIDDPMKRAAHLLRRAGFGGSLAEITELAKLSRDEAVDHLVNFEQIDNSALDARIAAANFNLSKPFTPPQGQGQLIQDMIRWWLTRMAYTARPLEERMTLIWHGLLTSQMSTLGERAKLMVAQNELFRAHALGRYDDLVKAVSRDPAMMIYLDTDESTKEHPNENYARELMELFTLGVGQYTEQDIRESARAFTGWRFTQPQFPGGRPNAAGLSEAERRELRAEAIAAWKPAFIMNPRQHDAGPKSFLGRSGNFDGDDIIDIIMQQPAAGRFIARRLFTEFANFNPESETIDRLTTVWESSGHSIKALVRAILVSDEFNSVASYRAFVRSPIELLIGLVRGLEIDSDFRGFDRFARQMDQVPFEPPNVAGWPGGETWLSSGTLFARANFLDILLFNRGRPLPLPVLGTPGAVAAADAVDAAAARLLDGDLPPASRDAIAAYTGAVRPPERNAAIAYLVLASPAFQLV